MRLRSHYVLLVATASVTLTAASVVVAAPVPFDGVTTYGQNFDSLASTGTTTPWADDTTIPGWYAWTAAPSPGGTPANYTVDAGGNVVGLLSEGSSGSTDRALGSRNANATGEIRYGMAFQNASGAPVTQVTVTYTGEQWRQDVSSQTATFDDKLSVNYKIQSTNPTTVAAGTQLTGSGWVAPTGLDFDSPQPQLSGTTGATPLDGNAAANRTTLSQTITLQSTWNAGQYLLIRWSDLNITGNDNTLAIDDLSVAPVPEPRSAAAAVLTAAAACLAPRVRRRVRPV